MKFWKINNKFLELKLKAIPKFLFDITVNYSRNREKIKSCLNLLSA